MTTYKTGGIADAGPAIIIGLLIGLIAAQLVGASPKTTNAAESAPFDHSQCQYPFRTTNPVDGCDNTDPCDPAQTKGGSGDCLPVGTAEKQQAISEHDAAFTPAPAKVSECEGK